MGKRKSLNISDAELAQAAGTLLKLVEVKVRAMKSAEKQSPQTSIQEWMTPKKWDETDTGIQPRTWQTVFKEQTSYRGTQGLYKELMGTPEFEVLIGTERESLERGWYFGASTDSVDLWIKEAIRSRSSKVGCKEQKISRLLTNIRLRSTELKGRVLLDGLELAMKRIRVNVRDDTIVVLERPTVQNMAFRPRLESRRATMDVIFPTALLRVQCRGTPYSTVQGATQPVIMALRLVGAGFFRIVSETYHIGSDREFAAATMHGLHPQCRLGNRLRIEESDRAWLRELIAKLYPLLHDGELDGNGKPTAIAFSRYCDSVEPNSCVEHCIARSIMGLEALYLPPSLKMDLARTLRMRAAKLLSFVGVDPIVALKDLNTGYGDRSTFVHGGMVTASDRRKRESDYGSMSAYARRLCEYLRLSVLMFLVINEKKEDVHRNIDHALLRTDENTPGEKWLYDKIKPWRRVLQQSIRLDIC